MPAELQGHGLKQLLKENTKPPVVAHHLPHYAKLQWDALPSPDPCVLQGDSGHPYGRHGRKAVPVFCGFCLQHRFQSTFDTSKFCLHPCTVKQLQCRNVTQAAKSKQ